jgi:excisionase family DNA binding protein
MVNDMADGQQNSGMLTVREVSSLLHIHPNTLRWWTDQGILKAYRLGPRGDRRFKQEDITIFLLGNTEDGVASANPSAFNSESKAEIG